MSAPLTPSRGPSGPSRAAGPAAALASGGEPRLQPVPERHILVVDDNRASRDMLAQLLRHFTCAVVVEAEDGESALGLMRQHKPCLTFLDVDMPGRSGLSVLEEWQRGAASPYVVMVTGLSAPHIVTAALQAQAQGFIVKPYSPQRIIDALRRYVAHTRDAVLLRRTVL